MAQWQEQTGRNQKREVFTVCRMRRGNFPFFIRCRGQKVGTQGYATGQKHGRSLQAEKIFLRIREDSG